MKRVVLAGVVTLMMLWGVCAQAETPEREQTMMIYMCGSNLESAGGCATADIQEILDARPDNKEVTVLIMLGGTNQWELGFDASETLIGEVRNRGGLRLVWRSAAMNMGQSETLASFLRYGVENYPAQEYSLVVWDHGGGPLEGVCWDEVFSMDHLTLEELTEGLAAAKMEKRLAWIGFDACLMSSLEVAGAVAPYAEYMVASQETEPASGWNYAFVKDVAGDADGGETGSRIVDAYFEGREASKEILTLACLDLSKVQGVFGEMDVYFGQLSREIDAQVFTALSGMRQSTTGFGKAVRSAGGDGYDLVDLRDLTKRLDGIAGDTARLAAALDELIVCSRSNQENTGGVSVYHPYVNKDEYASNWKAQYATMEFSQGYQAYVRQFGAWLTGEKLTTWANLQPTASAPDALGVQQVQLQLTEEQQAEMISAQMMILHGMPVDKDVINYTMVGAVPASLGEDGVLRAETIWPSLYLVDSDGNRSGPMSYEITDDGKYLYRYMRFAQDQTFLGANDAQVLYYIEPDNTGGEAEIAHLRVFDEATGSWTTRMEFSPEDYNWAHISELDRYAPQADEQGAFPPYWEWEMDYNTISYAFVNVENDWHFELDQVCDSDMDLYAIFQITDSQQNVYASEMVRLVTPNRTPLTVTTEPVEVQDMRVGLSGYVSRSADYRGLWLEFEVTNLSDTDMCWTPESDVLLNDQLCVPVAPWVYQPRHTLAPGETSRAKIAVDVRELYDVERITSIAVDMRLYPADDDYVKYDPVSLCYQVQDIGVTDITPKTSIMARAEADGVRWELLSIQSGGYSGHQLQFRITNARDEAFELYGVDLLLNKLHRSTTPDAYEIPANSTRIVAFDVTDDAFANFNSAEHDDYYVELSAYLQESYGYDAIHEITIMQDMPPYGETPGIVTMSLEEPWPLQRTRKSEHGMIEYYIRMDESQRVARSELVPLMENQLYSVQLERIFAVRTRKSSSRYEEGYYMQGVFYLCLHVSNLTDQILNLEFCDVSVIGQEDVPWEFGSLTDDLTLAPYQTQVLVIGFDNYYNIVNDAPFFNGLTFSCKGDKQSEPSEVSITLKEPAAWDVPSGTMIMPDGIVSSFSGYQKVAVEQETAEAWLGETMPFMEEILLPEDPMQYRAWLKAPVSAQTAANAVSGLVILFYREGDQLSLIGMEGMRRRGEEIGCVTGGLMLVSTEETPSVIPLIASSITEEKLTMYWFTSMQVYSLIDGLPDVCYYDDFQMELDYTAGQARLIVNVQEGELPPKQSMLTGVSAYSRGLEVSQCEGDSILHYEDMQKTYPGWSFTVEGVPVQLALRPYASLDDVCVLFSVEEADGSRYSLPLMRYQDVCEAY